MGLITKGVVHHRKAIIAVFAVLAVVCAVLFFGRQRDYDLTDYLPPDSESTKALGIMQEEFSSAVP